MVDHICVQMAQLLGKYLRVFLPLRRGTHAESCSQIFNDSVDAYASWTLFCIFVSILILISGVVLLTHKKPEPSTMQRDGGIAMNALSGRQIPRAADGKADGNEGVVHGEDDQVMWDVGEASDEEDEPTTAKPRFDSVAKASHGEEGEHLMISSHDDGDDSHTRTATMGGRRPTRRRSTSSVLRRDDDQDRDDGDGFGAFEGA
jgi:magnesium transporter